jgi:hypothetical protein
MTYSSGTANVTTFNSQEQKYGCKKYQHKGQIKLFFKRKKGQTGKTTGSQNNPPM